MTPYLTFCTTAEKVTHTLAGHYAGSAVNQNCGEDGAKHLEPLFCLVSTPQLDTEQGEECGRRCLLLHAAWRE